MIGFVESFLNINKGQINSITLTVEEVNGVPYQVNGMRAAKTFFEAKLPAGRSQIIETMSDAMFKDFGGNNIKGDSREVIWFDKFLISFKFRNRRHNAVPEGDRYFTNMYENVQNRF